MSAKDTPAVKATRAAAPAVKAMRAAAIDFRLLEYEYDPFAEAVGLQAAEALGLDTDLQSARGAPT
jgi:hypothetical protein